MKCIMCEDEATRWLFDIPLCINCYFNMTYAITTFFKFALAILEKAK